MTTSSSAPGAASDDGGDASLGTASMVLGVLGLLPIPGVLASVAAVALGLSTRMSDSATERGRQRAAWGICLGGLSLAIFGGFCLVYFVLLGYPLPHITRYHPEH